MFWFNLFLIFLGWTSAFALHEWVPIPMLLALSVMIYLTLFITYKKQLVFPDKKIIMQFLIFYIIIVLSFLYQIMRIGFNQTVLNHSLSYIGASVAYFFIPIIFLLSSKVRLEKIYKYLSYGVLIVSVIAISEFILRNFLGMNFHLGISRENIATYDIGGQRFIRTRGTTAESGHLAMYLLMFIPFVWLHFKKIFPLLIVLVAAFTTFSAAGLIDLGVLLFAFLIIYIIRKCNMGLRKIELGIGYLLICLSVIGAFLLVKYNGLAILSNMFEKITLVNYTIYDEGTRLARWHRALTVFLEHPIIGNGAGYTSILYGMGTTSFYLELLASMGLLGIVSWLFILMYFIKLIWNLNFEYKICYIISFSVMFVHMAVIGDYWYPWMWILFVLIYYSNFTSKLRYAQ